MSYLDARIAELKRVSQKVRRISSPDGQRPMAISEEYILIGGDAPTALNCRSRANRRNVLANVRRMMAAELAHDEARALKIWGRIAEYEERWG